MDNGSTSATGSGPIAAVEHARVDVFIRRATGALVLVVLGLGIAVWCAHAARAGVVNRVATERTLIGLAVEANLAASTRESATRLYLVTGDTTARTRAAAAAVQMRTVLDSLRLLTEADTSAHRAVASIGTLLDQWAEEFANPSLEPWRDLAAPDLRGRIRQGRALFDVARAQLDGFARGEKSRFARDSRQAARAGAGLGLAFVGAVLVLVLVVWELRRHLRRQLERATRTSKLIAQQNWELVEQRDALAKQTRELQAQADELLAQQMSLEEQATELEATLAELRETELKERQLVDRGQLLNRRLTEAQNVAQLGYFEIDGVTGHVFWSKEMYRLCGLEPGILPVPTDHYLSCVVPEDRLRMQEVAEQALTELREFTEQYRLRLPDGVKRTVQAKGRAIVDEDGHRKLIGTIQDITERVLLETQLRQSQKMEAVGTLAGGVAHDFNNVLTVIMSYSGILLAEWPEDARGRAELLEINKASEHAAGLTRQLLAFSRQQVLYPRPLCINEVIGDVERMLSRLLPANITFDARFGDNIATINADPGQLEQVLVNLAVNARDAMPDGGTLTVETSNVELLEGQAPLPPGTAPGRFVMLAVSDTGTGMSEVVRSRIFEPFFTTKEVGRGTGLGLSTVYGIVQQSGGYIWVYSEVGHGSTFKIFLPVSDSEMLAAEAPLSPAIHVGTETILLVEDEAVVRAAARRILTSAGFSVIEAGDGRQALEAFQAHSDTIDLVITDMIMPGLNGRELGDRLRDLQPDLRLLFISGYTDDTVLKRNLIDSSTSFLQKPFSPHSLTRKVREVLAVGQAA